MADGIVYRRPTYPDRAELAHRVGLFLKAAFSASGLSRKEAAELGDLSEGYLTGLLSGRAVVPNPAVVHAMARGWGFSVIEFYLTTGLITEDDVQQYVAKRETVDEGDAEDVASIYSRIVALPAAKRAKVIEALNGVLSIAGG